MTRSRDLILFEEAFHNEFVSINASIEALQNEFNVMQLPEEFNQTESDQQSVANQSEASNQSRASSSGSSSGEKNQSIDTFLAGSGPITFKGISLTIWTQFKEIFNRISEEKNYNLEEM